MSENEDAVDAVSARPEPERKAHATTNPRVGVPLILGAVVAAVGAFLPYEKLEVDIGTYSFTGVGSETVTGLVPAAEFEPGNIGIAVLVLSVLTLLLGVVVLLGRGRAWVGLAAFVLSGVALAAGIVALTAPARDAAKFGEMRAREFVGSVGVGAVLAVVGTGIAVVASIIALVAPRSAPGDRITVPKRTSRVS